MGEQSSGEYCVGSCFIFYFGGLVGAVYPLPIHMRGGIWEVPIVKGGLQIQISSLPTNQIPTTTVPEGGGCTQAACLGKDMLWIFGRGEHLFS